MLANTAQRYNEMKPPTTKDKLNTTAGGMSSLNIEQGYKEKFLQMLSTTAPAPKQKVNYLAGAH